MAGAASVSRRSAERYGAAASSGIAASNTDIACPSFAAPPLSSPRVANSCSAVRAATWSVAARDSRLAAAAVRAACRSGSTASRLPRQSAPVGRTGRSFLPAAPPEGCCGRGCPSVISAILLLCCFLGGSWPGVPAGAGAAGRGGGDRTGGRAGYRGEAGSGHEEVLEALAGDLAGVVAGEGVQQVAVIGHLVAVRVAEHGELAADSGGGGRGRR